MAASSVQSLTREDAEALAELPLITGAAPESSGNGQLVVGQVKRKRADPGCDA